ncbi:MAG: fluoride efflux transporter CrcB [Gemmatimonadetes bacterium]|nr:fluoride efflux transporter CrcB [Gemmatimonadota bacterium]
MNWVAIALGGGLGSVARYALGLALERDQAHLPWATLAINVSGSLLLGFLARWFAATEATPALRLGLMMGLCGGYTTFSTFSLETARLLEIGAWGRATTYSLLSVALCVGATFAGFAIARGLGAHPVSAA